MQCSLNLIELNNRIEASNILLKDPSNVNNIIFNELSNYGIRFDNFDNFYNFITIKQDQEFNNILHKSLVNNIFINDQLIIKNDIFTIGYLLGKGGWNLNYNIIDNTNSSKQLVLRYLFDNELYPKSPEHKLKISFYENYINILLTIIQEKIFKFKCVNSCIMIGLNTNIHDKHYVYSINEKADMDCFKYFLNENIIISKDKFINMTLKIFTKLLFMQKTINFMHYDLHLENIFCTYRDNILDPYFSDLGTAEFSINGYEYKGNPDFIRNSKDQSNCYFGKDIVYYFTSTIKKLYRYILDINTKYEDNILEIINYIFSIFASKITNVNKKYYESTFNNNEELLILILNNNIDGIKKYMNIKLLLDKDARIKYNMSKSLDKEDDYVKTIINERAIFEINYDYKEFNTENIMIFIYGNC